MSKAKPEKQQPYRTFFLFRPRVIIGALVLLFCSALVVGAISTVNQENRIKAAAAAEQARLAADPITVPNIYTALNKARAGVGSSALGNLPNLTTAAEQYCNEMVINKYFDYKNPASGKEANTFIKDNAGSLYLRNYVASIFKAVPSRQTASDAVQAAVAAQSTNINNPVFNSVGWAICDSPIIPGEKYVVGMFADNQERPVAPVNNYYSAPSYRPIYVPSTPIYKPPTSIHCTSNTLFSTTYTNCY